MISDCRLLIHRSNPLCHTSSTARHTRISNQPISNCKSAMATITTFEELGIWQKARELCKEIWALTQKDRFAKDFGLKDQINRSSGSCMDNIAEGFERDGTKEFVQFLSISKGSIGETRSQLYRALDRGHITQEEFDQASTCARTRARTSATSCATCAPRTSKATSTRANQRRRISAQQLANQPCLISPTSTPTSTARRSSKA